MADRVGQQLGNYRLIRLLGRGGFAEVYLGEHQRLQTHAAIKVLRTQLAEDDVEGFLKEARTIAHLEHPHIVRVFDFDVEEGTPFLVMSYAPNGNLRQRHPKGTILPLTTIVSYVKQVTNALQYAHDEKLIHRDIKPENMLLGRHNDILLSDFGIALVTQSSRLQSTQEAVGTAAYMAPEQLQGKPRRASDQYALGIVVYEWLCGERPFNGNFTELYSQHMFVPPPPLHQKVPTLLPEVEQVVLTTLAKDPKERFVSIQAFATALEQACQSSRPAQSHPVVLPSGVTLPPQPLPPTKVVAPSSAGQLPQSTNVVTPPSSLLPPTAKAPASSAPVTSPDSKKETVTSSRPQPSKRGVSRRAVAEMARSSTPPAVRPDAMVAARPVKHNPSQRIVLVALAGLVIVALASGIVRFITHQASPTGGIHASQAKSINNFPLPTASSGPSGITAGPDGNLWFTENTGNQIGRISPSGTITEFPLPTADSGPDGITAGSDGNLWFTENTGNQVRRITSGR